MSSAIPPDDPNGFEADLVAMRHDARAWGEASNDIWHTVSTVSSLNLDDAHFSFLGSQTGLTASYSGLRDRAMNLLEEAATNIAGLSDTLRKVDAIYTEKDAHAENEMNRIDGGG